MTVAQMNKDELLAVFLPHLRAVRGLEPVLRDSERVVRWLSTVFQSMGGDVDRVVAQIQRLRFLGAAETAVAVAERMGVLDPTISMREVVAQKLLRIPTILPSAEQELEFALMQSISERFYRKFAHLGCQKDRKALGAIISGRPVGESTRPWMWGCPTDIVSLNGKTYIVGYRAELTPNRGAESRWVYQEHQYRRVALDYGIDVAGMLVAKLHVGAEGHLDLSVLEVPYDPDKEAALIEAGDHFWAFRCRDELPPLPSFQKIDAAPADLYEAAEDMAALIEFADHSVARRNALQTTLANRLEGFDVGGVSTLGPLVVRSESSLDEGRAVRILGADAEAARVQKPSAEKMVAWFRANEIDVSQFMEPGGYDGQRLAAMLADRGVPADLTHTRKLSIRPMNSFEASVAQRGPEAQPGLLDVVPQDAMSEMQLREESNTPSFVVPAVL